MIRSISPAFKGSYIPEYQNAQQAEAHKNAILERAAQFGENVTVKTVNVIETKNSQWSPQDLRLFTDAIRKQQSGGAKIFSYDKEKEGLHGGQLSRIFDAFDKKSFFDKTIDLNVRDLSSKVIKEPGRGLEIID